MKRYYAFDRGIFQPQALHNVAIHTNPVTKDRENSPMFTEGFFGEPSLPWEVRYDNAYPNVIYDEEAGLYRLYYTLIIYDPESARYIRRGYPLEVFDTAVHELKRRNLTVIVHVILFLPGETHEMMLETIEYLNHSDIDGIKLQLLHILKGTDLAVEYQKCLSDPAYTGPAFHIPDADEYIRLLTECIQHLRPEIVIHRLTGDGPKDLLIAPLWTGAKRTVLNQIHKYMKDHDLYQGKEYYG